jgi:general stress protein 26
MKLIPALGPAELRQAALEVISTNPFPILASLDGDQARVRPVSPVRTEEFTVYVASMRSSHKTGEIESNAKVELCYLSNGHDQVRVTGIAENVTDGEVRQSIWDANPLLRAYLKSVDNPEFILYRIVPREVRYMKEWALEYQVVDLEA